MDANLSKKRILWLDIARGICIILMVTLHFYNYRGTGTPLPWLTTGWFLIFFFFCSGIVFSDKKNFKDYALGLAKKLLVPYFVSTSIIFLIKIQSGALCWGLSWADKIKTFISSLLISLPASFEDVPVTHVTTFGIGPIWFFMCMFFSCIIFRLIYKLKGKLLISILMAVIAVISQKYILLPFNIQDAFIGCMIMAFGSFLKPYIFKLVEILKKLNPIFILVLSFCCAALHRGAYLMVESKGFDLGSNRYNFYSLLPTFTFFLFIIVLSVFIEKTALIDEFLGLLGKETLLVVVLHNFDILLLRDWYMRDYSFIIGTLALYFVTILIYRRASTTLKEEFSKLKGKVFRKKLTQ